MGSSCRFLGGPPLQLGNGLVHQRRRGSPSGGSEIVPPALEPKRALQSSELAHRVGPFGGRWRPNALPPPPPAQYRVANGTCGPADLGVTRIRLLTEQLDRLAVLGGREPGRLPDPRGAALLLDLFRQPLEGLSSLGV